MLEVGFETAKTRLRYAMAKLRARCMGALPSRSRRDERRSFEGPAPLGDAAPMMSESHRDDDLPRDAWLREALRHAPDAGRPRRRP